MYFLKYVIAVILGVFVVSMAKAQSEIEQIEEELLEYIAENSEEELDFGEITEHLLFLQRHPLSLNKATEAQLAEIYILNPLQITHILEHRRKSGDFLSVDELIGLEAFDLQLVELLKNFLTVEEGLAYKDLSVKDVLGDSEQELMLRFGRVLEKSAGYLQKEEGRSRYLGSPNQWGFRYRMNYKNNVRVALTTTKSAGEPFFGKYQPLGFDFISGSISIRQWKETDQLIVGDYALQLGQGLVFWNGINFGKGAWAASMAKQGLNLKPYTSTNENQFLRGAAGAFSRGRFQFLSFVSLKKRDGNLDEDSEEKRILSLPVSGLHRTPSELKNRKTVREIVIGQNIQYRLEKLNLGMTWTSAFWDGEIVKRDPLRHAFDFEGRNLNSVSLNYDFALKNVYLYGETAHSVGGGVATVNGLVSGLHPALSFFVNHRYYPKNYWHVYAQSVGESSLVNNEKGLYAGFAFHPSRSIHLFIHSDLFAFPWMRFRADGPSYGRDLLAQFEYIWYKKGKMLFRYRNKMRQENLTEVDLPENILVDIHRHQFRGEFQYSWSGQWKTRSRAELLLYHKELKNQEKGWLLFQDVFYTPETWNSLRLNARLAYYHTASYDSRLYAYENDVLYASGFPFYYLKGWRGYLNIRFKATQRLDFWARYALTLLPGEESLSSGLNEIEGNKRQEIKLQLRWKL